MNYRIKLVLVLLLTANLVVDAQNDASLSKQADEAYRVKDYKRSAELYRAAIDKEQNKSNLAYNAASGFALAGEKEEAFKLLKRAIELGYLNVSQLKADTDFQSLHKDARWQKILERAEDNSKNSRKFWDSSEIATPYRENLSENEKIAGLAKLWSEVKYNFVNFDLVPDVNWDRIFVEYLPRVRATESTFEYYKVLIEMIARLRDGHSNVYFPEELHEKAYSRPLLRTNLIETKVIVTDILDERVAEQGVRVGQEVTEIDGVPVKEFAEKHVRPYQSSSTEQDLIKRTYNYNLLAGDREETVRLTLVDEKGETRAVELRRYSGAERSKLNLAGPEAFEYRVLPGNIGYVALNSFGTDRAAEEFEKKFAEIARTDALIIDIRQNGGGNSSVGWRILSFLTDRDRTISKWHTREYRPTHRAWRMPEEKYGDLITLAADNKRYYGKPVAVLIGPETFSAAEDFAVAFDVLDRGPLIGEPTGGSTGQPLLFKLPGGGLARVTTKRDSYPDGREFVGTGIRPDLPVRPAIADIRGGRDTVLEAARKKIAELLKK